MVDDKGMATCTDAKTGTLNDVATVVETETGRPFASARESVLALLKATPKAKIYDLTETADGVYCEAGARIVWPEGWTARSPSSTAAC